MPPGHQAALAMRPQLGENPLRSEPPRRPFSRTIEDRGDAGDEQPDADLAHFHNPRRRADSMGIEHAILPLTWVVTFAFHCVGIAPTVTFTLDNQSRFEGLLLENARLHVRVARQEAIPTDPPSFATKGPLRYVDLETRRVTREILSESDRNPRILYSESRQFASVERGERLFIVDLQSGTDLFSVPLRSGLYAMVSPDAELLLIRDDRGIKVHRVPDGAVQFSFDGQFDRFYFVGAEILMFDLEGSGSTRQGRQFWNTRTWMRDHRFDGHDGLLGQEPDRRRLLCKTWQGKPSAVLDYDTGKVLFELPASMQFESPIFTPDGEELIAIEKMDSSWLVVRLRCADGKVVSRVTLKGLVADPSDDEFFTKFLVSSDGTLVYTKDRPAVETPWRLQAYFEPFGIQVPDKLVKESQDVAFFDWRSGKALGRANGGDSWTTWVHWKAKLCIIPSSDWRTYRLYRIPPDRKWDWLPWWMQVSPAPL